MFFLRMLIFICIFFITPVLFSEDYDLFESIVKAYTSIQTVDSGITQIIKEGKSRNVYKGRFRADSRGRFRVDYYYPEKQIVVCGKKILQWYYPRNKILYQLKSKSFALSRPRFGPFSNAKAINAKNYKMLYLGKHLLGFFNTANLYSLENKKTGFVTLFWISEKKKVVLRKVVKDKKGYEIVKETYAQFKQINNKYIPHYIDVLARTRNGTVRSTTHYKNLVINRKLSPNIFKLTFPGDVKRRELK